MAQFNLHVGLQTWDFVVDLIFNRNWWIDAGWNMIKIVLIIAFSHLAKRIIHRSIEHLIRARERKPLTIRTRRTRTMGKLLQNTATYTIYFITLLLVLDVLGFQLLPLLAGAGIVGIAIGFGAQNLIKDIITGFFIIFEDQFGVGDVVQLNGVKGTVIEIGLRITKIKTWNGEVHIIPNGAIQQVANFSIYNSVAVADVTIALEADYEKALDVLRQMTTNLQETERNIVGQPQVLGVQTLDATGLTIRVTAECLPNTQFAVARKLNETIKKSFDEHGIEIPYPRIVTYSSSS